MRDPYTRGHFSSGRWKGEKGCAQAGRASLPQDVTGWQVFCSSPLTSADGKPQRPSPTHPSSPWPEKKKKSKQHVTTHPSGYIQICLREERRKRENSAPISLQFSPRKKNIPCFYLLPASAPVLLALALFTTIASISASPATTKEPCKLWVLAVRSLTYLGAPSGHRIAPDRGEKCGREDRGEPELRECASAGAPGGGRPRAALTHSVWAIMDSACSCTGDFIPKFASQYPICSYTTKDFSVPRQ